MNDDDILDACAEALPSARTTEDIMSIRVAARFSWMRKEMGGMEHVLFAHRNNTPIVPFGHECHPVELVKRGFVDGIGWVTQKKPASERVKYTQWPCGKHWYAALDGKDIGVNSVYKWSTREAAEKAVGIWLKLHNP